MAVIDGNGTLHIGPSARSDDTTHKDPARKARFIGRHLKQRQLRNTGGDTAGFMAHHLRWHKPTLDASVKELSQRYTARNFKMNI